MALTNAERKKKYLDKIKADGRYDEFKKKKNAEEKCRRDRIKNGLELLPKAVREKTKRLNRAYNRKKVAECRQRKKGGIASSEPNRETHSEQIIGTPIASGNYKTYSALSKAAAKIKRALPSTSGKKVAAVRKVLRCLDENEYQQIVCVDKKSKPTRGIKPDVINMVKSFYERDDISRISPNIRDCRKFKDPITGVKELKQIRYLMYRLSDVYSLFLRHIRKGNSEEDPPIGLAKFCSLRPTHIKLVSCTPLDQCLCIYHSNFIMCCKAIHRYMPEFPLYGEKLERLILCEDPKKDCWLRNCSECNHAETTLNEIFDRSGKKHRSPVVWNQWKKNDTTNRFENCLERATLKKLIGYFLDILPEFLKHSRIKRCQAIRFQQDNEEVVESDGEMLLLQIDFAESFTCESQDEIQSAHWNQANVSMFTACLKVSQEIFPKAITSDDTSHTKFEIACYMYKIIKKIPKSVKTLKIWSDGPNSQFKNRFMAAFVKTMETVFQLKVFWNFFATSHGKGSVDGIGAAVKNRVKRLVKSRHAIVNCSKDFVEAFNTEDSVIEVMDMNDKEMKKIRKDLQLDKVFGSAPVVSDIFGFHQIQMINGNIIGFTTSQEGYDHFGS